MIKLIRRNQRLFLTALTILSMVMFVVSQKGNGNSQDRADPVYATILGKPVHTSDLASAKAEIQAVSHYVRMQSPYGGTTSLLDNLFGPELAEQIAGKPEWFVMLRMEADAASVVPDKDSINELLANYAKDPVTDQPLDPTTDAYAVTQAGVADCLKIFQRYQQVKDAVKISRPQRDHELAKEDQTLEMNLVQLSGYDYIAKLTPPTSQQIQDQFTRFADTTPHEPNPTTNPFGFGYKLPVRAKVQYLRMSSDEVAKTIIATKSPYDWEVAARKYYLNNPSEFDLKPVTTGPATSPSTAPAIPQTYDQAHDRVLQAIRSPLVSEKRDEVISYVNSTLNTDYQKYLAFCTANKGGDEPDSSLGVRYSSFSYITKLTDAVQAKFKVSLLGNETDLLPLTKIADLPQVGSSDLSDFVGKQETLYLTKAQAADPSAPAVLMKPTQPLNAADDKGNVTSVVFARLSTVLPSQAPSDVLLVQGDVIKDLNLQAGYKMAQDQAAALQTAAKTVGLPLAATTIGKSVIALQGADAISAYSTDIKPIVPALGDAARSFTDQAYEMTGSYDPTNNPHPIQSIELPTQGRVFVAQLTSIKADWNSESFLRDVMMAQAEAGQETNALMRNGWFKLDAVTKRTDFVVK